MANTFTLTRKQQEILLRGLRYVRSSVALDSQEWSPEVEEARNAHYQEIAQLEKLLNGVELTEMTASV